MVTPELKGRDLGQAGDQASLNLNMYTEISQIEVSKT